MMVVREHRYKPEDILLTWQIASSLSHHPHWHVFNRLTASCSQDQVILQLRKLWQGHDDVYCTSPAAGLKGIPQECNLSANLAGKKLSSYGISEQAEDKVKGKGCEKW